MRLCVVVPSRVSELSSLNTTSLLTRCQGADRVGDARTPTKVRARRRSGHQNLWRCTVKPLLYGYVRVASDMADDEIDRIEQQTKRFADIEGFCYATTFYEYQSAPSDDDPQPA